MRQRVVTALLLALPALLALALRTPWPLFVLACAAGVIGVQEAERLAYAIPSDPTALPNLSRKIEPSVLMVPFGCWQGMAYRDGAATVSCGAAFALIGIVCQIPRLYGVASFGAVLYLCGPFVSVLALHRSALGTGLWCLSPALMALVPVWAGDIAAIFAGRAFGKHPLAPKISPKKTVEGGLANLVAAVFTAWLLGRLLGLPDVRSLGAGLAVGVLGQAGDLFESWLKRRAGVKDSGTLLPGHGGVLDRIDSVLFAAPAVALILLG